MIDDRRDVIRPLRYEFRVVKRTIWRKLVTLTCTDLIAPEVGYVDSPLIDGYDVQVLMSEYQTSVTFISAATAVAVVRIAICNTVGLYIGSTNCFCRRG
jgi:hypothetical protein